MDVERIQKVNDLAVDLMKQGLAKDREDAIAQAEKIFKANETEEYASIRENMKDAEKPAESVVLDHDKITEILEKNTTFLVNKIKEFQQKIDSLEREITVLKSTQSSQPIVKEMVSEPPIEDTPAQEPSQPAEPAKDHPRSGNYNDEDVSIEKFFYMGKK